MFSISLSHSVTSSLPIYYIFLKDFIYLFLEGGEGREKERERNISVWLPLTRPLLGTWPATQTCALTGNQTGNPFVCRSVLNPLSHTSQGLKWVSSRKHMWSRGWQTFSFLDQTVNIRWPRSPCCNYSALMAGRGQPETVPECVWLCSSKPLFMDTDAAA